MVSEFLVQIACCTLQTLMWLHVWEQQILISEFKWKSTVPILYSQWLQCMCNWKWKSCNDYMVIWTDPCGAKKLRFMCYCLLTFCHRSLQWMKRRQKLCDWFDHTSLPLQLSRHALKLKLHSNGCQGSELCSAFHDYMPALVYVYCTSPFTDTCIHD